MRQRSKGGSHRSTSRRPLVAAAGAIVALVPELGAGEAFAYWNTHGTGSAAESTGTSAAVTVQAVASGTVSSKLVPGGSADLLVQLDNPNRTVTVVGVAQDTSRTAQVVGGSGCTAANSGVSVTTQTGLAVAVGTGTQVVHIANGAGMAAGSASGCQGAVVELPVTVTVDR